MQEVWAVSANTMGMQFRDVQNLGWIGAVVGCSALAFGVAWFSKGAPASEQPVSILPLTGPSTTPSESQFSSQVVIHVVGLVKKPGMYKLPGGSRVQDAIDAAGGAGANADLESLNLAQILTDGVQVRVSKVGAAPVEPVAELTPGAGAPVAGGSTPRSSSSARPAAKSISLNTASAAELDRLPGVGPSTAAKILEYRRSHGGFASIDELLSVKGIGPKKLKDMRPYLRL